MLSTERNGRRRGSRWGAAFVISAVAVAGALTAPGSIAAAKDAKGSAMDAKDAAKDAKDASKEMKK